VGFVGAAAVPVLGLANGGVVQGEGVVHGGAVVPHHRWTVVARRLDRITGNGPRLLPVQFDVEHNVLTFQNMADLQLYQAYLSGNEAYHLLFVSKQVLLSAYKRIYYFLAFFLVFVVFVEAGGGANAAFFSS